MQKQSVWAEELISSCVGSGFFGFFVGNVVVNILDTDTRDI